MAVEISRTLDYSNKPNLPCRYRMHNQVPLQAPVMALNSTCQGQFQLAPVVLNLHESVLRFNLTLPLVVNRFSVGYLNRPPIQSLSLDTQSGVNLVSIPNFREYVQMCAPPTIPRDSWSNDYYGFVSEIDLLARHSALGNAALAAGIESPTITQAGVFEANATDYNGISQVITGGNPGPGNGAAVTAAYAIHLGRIPHTLFSAPYDLYFAGEQLVLTVTFVQGVDTGFTSTDAILSATAQFAALPILSGVSLDVAYQDNQEISDVVKSKVMSEGIETMISYPYQRFEITDNTGSYSRQWNNLNLGMGKNLLAVYSGLFRSNGVVAKVINNNNAQALWSLYRSWLDNVPLQDGPRGVYQVFADLKDDFEGSIIGHVFNWMQNSVQVQNFTSMKLTDLAHQTPDSGIDLSQAHTFQTDYTKSALQLTAHVAFICSRKLRLSPAGITLTSI